MRGHTGNSIRSRFRKHLESRLNYIYKTDDQDQLIRDEAGNLIKIGLDEMPGTLKNKFTPEDDYLLCCVALEYMASNNIDSIGLRYSFLMVCTENIVIILYNLGEIDLGNIFVINLILLIIKNIMKIVKK